MNAALLTMAAPLLAALLMLALNRWHALLALAAVLLSFLASLWALYSVAELGTQQLQLGGWQTPLAIRFQLMPVNALLLGLSALIHLLVAMYAVSSRHCQPYNPAFWWLSLLLQGSMAALWLSMDLFNWYVTLELLTLAAVAMVAIAGKKAYAAALRYLLLSLLASLAYLLGVAMIYGEYGMLDIGMLAGQIEASPNSQAALLLISIGLLLKAAAWPLHIWLPAAHSKAPTAVSALLSALVVKGPLFILWLIWTRLAPGQFAEVFGFWLALAGLAALLSGGWSALRTPYLKSLVAHSTVAQLGYALLALGLLLHWQVPDLHAALWLFIIAHALAKTSMFLAAGELQAHYAKTRIAGLSGAIRSIPLTMFAFAVAGGSLIGLPPSGGFIAKWTLLQAMLLQPTGGLWALGILLASLLSAAYVFRLVAIGFAQSGTEPELPASRWPQWLALTPALLAWLMVLGAAPMLIWLGALTT